MKSKWLQSSLLLIFSGTVLFSGHVGVLKARIINEKATVYSIPNPPRALPDSASPYWKSIVTSEEKEQSEPVSLKLDMVATEDAWVEVETDGQPSYAKLVHADQTLSFQATESIRLTTGNASGLDLRFNGAPVTNSAAAGRKRTLEFTSAGARLLKSAHVAKS